MAAADTSGILAALRSVALPPNTRKAAESAREDLQSRGCTLGLNFGYGRNVVALTKPTTDWPELTQVLCQACRQANPTFKFTSIQVNLNAKYTMHTDGRDAGPSRMIACGDFQRGRLWLHESAESRWSVEDVHDRWLAFDGREYHFVEEWEGSERFSLVYFTNPMWQKAENSDVQETMSQLGFAWPSCQKDTFQEPLSPWQQRREAGLKELPRDLRKQVQASLKRMSAERSGAATGERVFNLREYSAAISNLGARWELALELFREMSAKHVEPNAISYNAMIGSLGKGAQWRMAFAMLQEMRDEVVPTDVLSYNNAVNACARAAEWQRALQVVQAALEDNTQPDEILRGAVIGACARAAQWAPALAMLQPCAGFPAIASAVSAYGAALSACERRRQWRHAQQLLQSMVDRRVAPDIICFNRALVACSAAGPWQQALELWWSLPRLRLRPVKESLRAAIRACSKDGGAWEHAVFLLEEGRRMSLAVDQSTVEQIFASSREASAVAG
eukprot:TRINITY_DN32865_c3_g3_i1.p1 TRINITY_DN32865_c3_g3~~TRINITY_DN32865_c3_g3_i1.p1  ORF type:complete len:505 (+),score=115.95 TRINITY_DN32865_c3_g3_i1:253-1767(+)